jgi:hypothetical protein
MAGEANPARRPAAAGRQGTRAGEAFDTHPTIVRLIGNARAHFKGLIDRIRPPLMAAELKQIEIQKFRKKRSRK